MKNYILALDQGTTSSRAILFDHEGRIGGCAAQEFPQHFPRPGWVEHHADDIWTSQLAVARQVLREASVRPAQVRAIGIANQRETTVLWERETGRPVGPAIVWQDRRTADQCDAMRAAGKAALIRDRTGLELDAYFSATKLAWLLDHVPDARARAERGELCFGTVDSWLVFNLCGAHVTDVSNASRTMLFNIHLMRWDADLLALFDIPEAVLPEVVSSSAEIGATHADLFGSPIPVAGIAGDQQAATFGQACHVPGMVKNTYGTGCFMLMHAGARPAVSHERLLSTVGWRLHSSDDMRPCYLLEGSVFMGGATVQWLRDGLGIIRQSGDVEALAASVPDSGGVMLVPAFVGLGAPHWDQYARGTIVGLTRGSTAAHIARAAVEAIAYQSAELLAAMQRDAAQPVLEVRADGGAARNDLLMQFQADLLGVPVLRPRVTETTALGAAYLAGLAVHFWSSMEEIAAQWQCERRFEPAMPEDRRAALLARWGRAVERSRGWEVD
ncbi:glycerol kinase GlpK [Pseudoduganella albidiflava]|uniref:Glycerol kinase n=1 Tax=Pseudoduganella albidiflava TaxID=321983 RepID=A0A411X3P2_9BURK|nr:glycerol kinase GlpK [Pseudoduganella albidiflava]QBI03503.1 glycerol kinase [Pseudoduganella albidiflava]GGY50536.1 glycerol kinase [Pseudoduganella albidiflava]